MRLNIEGIGICIPGVSLKGEDLGEDLDSIGSSLMGDERAEDFSPASDCFHGRRQRSRSTGRDDLALLAMAGELDGAIDFRLSLLRADVDGMTRAPLCGGERREGSEADIEVSPAGGCFRGLRGRRRSVADADLALSAMADGLEADADLRFSMYGDDMDAMAGMPPYGGAGSEAGEADDDFSPASDCFRGLRGRRRSAADADLVLSAMAEEPEEDMDGENMSGNDMEWMAGTPFSSGVWGETCEADEDSSPASDCFRCLRGRRRSVADADLVLSAMAAEVEADMDLWDNMLEDDKRGMARTHVYSLVQQKAGEENELFSSAGDISHGRRGRRRSVADADLVLSAVEEGTDLRRSALGGDVHVIVGAQVCGVALGEAGGKGQHAVEDLPTSDELPAYELPAYDDEDSDGWSEPDSDDEYFDSEARRLRLRLLW